MITDKKDLYRYWGKAIQSDDKSSVECHLLPYHCLDVAAVAAYWWDHDPALKKLFCQEYCESKYRGWLLFFIALHDLGKWDIRFQVKCWTAWAALNPEPAGKNVIGKKWDHGQGGLYWFVKDFDTDDDYDSAFIAFHEHPKQQWLPWMEAVAGHHGYIYQHTDLGASPELALPYQLKPQGERDKQARLAWINALAKLFLHPAGLFLNDDPPPCSPLLAGFCSVSDWLGSWSTEDTFCYQSTPEPLGDYFSRRYAVDAPLVTERSGLIGTINPWGGVGALLDARHQPRQLQTLVGSLPIQPGLTIIEAPTGSGKTETALAYAWRLINLGYADSIIFALPTQATANAMLNRLDKLAARLFEHPNLILAHGNSRFSKDFAAIKLRGENVQDQDAWGQCCEWLSRSNKRAFLGQIGVCTIDQVLISVLPVKHRFIRGFGIARSILLVDEVHAYDTYMHSLLEEVLRQQSLAGQSALLLSATLPAGLKQRLLATYGNNNLPPSAEYPLIIWQQQEQQHCFDLSATPQHLPASFNLFIDRRYLHEMQPDAGLLEQMIVAAQAGAQVCLICNLVDVAQQVYQQLCASTELEIILFHSRFTLTDRMHKEGRTLGYFGASGDRRIGRILVATQVVEQSLDVDFDWLITQLCPVDLLFQRAGRLHRHSRRFRAEGFQQPVLTVLLPTTHDYGGSNYIYTNTRAMWRTQQLLEKLQQTPLRFPEAYRLWIDEVYQGDVDAQEPGWVEEGMEMFERTELKKRYNARQSLNQAGRVIPFADDDVHVRAVTRDGEMSLPLIPYIATDSGKQLLDGQFLQQLPEFAIPEALALNRVNVPGSWQRKFKLGPDEEGLVWIAGTMLQNQWIAETVGGRLLYSKEVGMTGIPTSAQKDLGT